MKAGRIVALSRDVERRKYIALVDGLDVHIELPEHEVHPLGPDAANHYVALKEDGTPVVLSREEYLDLREAEMDPKLRVKLLCDDAKVPEIASLGSAGYDLFASEEVKVEARGSVLVSTGIAMEIPDGHVGIIKPRSGLAVKKGIDIGAGVIDSDYRGEVKVLIRNTSDEEQEFQAGDKIAQMVVVKYYGKPVEVVEELSSTDRGAGGFGSTGV